MFLLLLTIETSLVLNKITNVMQSHCCIEMVNLLATCRMREKLAAFAVVGTIKSKVHQFVLNFHTTSSQYKQIILT